MIKQHQLTSKWLSASTSFFFSFWIVTLYSFSTSDTLGQQALIVSSAGWRRVRNKFGTEGWSKEDCCWVSKLLYKLLYFYFECYTFQCVLKFYVISKCKNNSRCQDFKSGAAPKMTAKELRKRVGDKLLDTSGAAVRTSNHPQKKGKESKGKGATLCNSKALR